MNITQEDVDSHINRLEGPADYSILRSTLEKLFNQKKLDKLDTYTENIISMFNRFKEDKLFTLTGRYPNLSGDKLKSTFIINIESSMISNLFTYSEIEKKLSKLISEKHFSKKEFMFIRINTYLNLCESIVFLFDDILVKCGYEQPHSVGVLNIFLEEKYPQFKNMFESINNNIRNSIGHGYYNIDDDKEELKFSYYNKTYSNFKTRILSFKEFEKMVWETIYLFEVIFKNLDKCFIEEIKMEYRKNGFEC